MVSVSMTTTAERIRIEELDDLEVLSRTELIEAINEGLPSELASELAGALKIRQDELANLLRLTPRTLQRRREEGRLELAESERVWELSRLISRATEVLETKEGAISWLKSPIQALGWKSPLALAQTAVGLREVENVLGRIEHGVFS